MDAVEIKESRADVALLVATLICIQLFLHCARIRQPIP